MATRKAPAARKTRKVPAIARKRPGRKKGTPKTGGRQKGTPNKVTVEARAAAALIVDDPIYRRNLAQRARKGKLAPPVETMLWHYAKGKPVERHEVGDPGEFDVSKQETDALKARLAALLTEIP